MSKKVEEPKEKVKTQKEVDHEKAEQHADLIKKSSCAANRIGMKYPHKRLPGRVEE